MNPIMITKARETRRGHRLLPELLKDLAAAAALMILPQTLAAALAIGLDYAQDSAGATLLMLWAQGLTLLMTILYCRFLQRRTADSIGLPLRGAAKGWLSGAAHGFSLMASAAAVGVLTGTYAFSGFAAPIRPAALFLLLIGYILQGMAEEMLCRGFLLVSLARKNAVSAAVIVSSLFFALIHLPNDGVTPLCMINLLLFSLLASLLMLRDGHLWHVGALHAMWNFSQQGIFGFPVSGIAPQDALLRLTLVGSPLSGGGAFGPEGGLIVTAVLAVELAAFALQHRAATRTPSACAQETP